MFLRRAALSAVHVLSSSTLQARRETLDFHQISANVDVHRFCPHINPYIYINLYQTARLRLISRHLTSCSRLQLSGCISVHPGKVAGGGGSEQQSLFQDQNPNHIESGFDFVFSLLYSGASFTSGSSHGTSEAPGACEFFRCVNRPVVSAGLPVAGGSHGGLSERAPCDGSPHVVVCLSQFYLPTHKRKECV